MDSFDSALRQRLAERERALQRVEQEIAPLFAQRARLYEEIGYLRGLFDLSDQHQGDAPTETRRPGADQRPRHFLDDAQEILTAAGPAGMHYTEVLEALLERGVTVPGANPGSNLIAHMRRDPGRFAGNPRRGRGYYRAADTRPA